LFGGAGLRPFGGGHGYLRWSSSGAMLPPWGRPREWAGSPARVTETVASRSGV